MTEKRCHICGNEVRENYYLDKRGYTCYTCSKAIASKRSKVILDLSQFDDIDLDDFIEWFMAKYINKEHIKGYGGLDWYKDKYDVDIWFHRDKENKKFSVWFELVEKKKGKKDDLE